MAEPNKTQGGPPPAGGNKTEAPEKKVVYTNCSNLQQSVPGPDNEYRIVPVGWGIEEHLVRPGMFNRMPWFMKCADPSKLPGVISR